MEQCLTNDCKINTMLSIIKPKYNAVVIFSLQKEKKLFTQLKEEFKYMSNEQINRVLKNLSKNQVINKKSDYYCLTLKGKELYKVLKDLEKIQVKYD
ncbi:MAG: winged helix-turn-helix transcriptional regulator [Mycoplasmatales bacterium]